MKKLRKSENHKGLLYLALSTNHDGLVKLKLFTFFLFLSIFCFSQKDSLIDYQSKLTLKYITKGEIDNANLYSDSIINQLQSKNDTVGILTWLSKKGNKENYVGYVDNAKLTFTQGLQLATRINDVKWRCTFLLGLNGIYRFKEEPGQSSKLIQEALVLAKSSNDPKLLVQVYKAYAVMAFENKQREKSEIYLDSALAICIKHGLINQEAGIYAANGRKLSNSKATAREAIGWLQKSLKVQNSTGLEPWTHGIHQSFGIAYHSLEMYDSSLYHYGLSLKFKRQNGNNQGTVFALIRTGDVYLALGNTTRAKELYNEGLQLALKINRPRSTSSVSYNLYEIYKKEGNYVKALEMFEIHKVNSDETKNELYKRKSIQQEYEVTYAQQALSDSLQAAKEKHNLQLIHQEEINNKNKTRNQLLIAGIVFLLLAGGGWSRANFIKKANARLEIERNKAEESERFKQRFLANMSHEIRTPMNAVLGMANLTLDTDLNEKQEVYVNAIKSSSENLLVVINDILDLSKLELGRLEFESIPFRITDTFKDLDTTLRFKAEAKKLSFQTHIPDELEKVFIGDPSRLHQILVNLTSNAIKFTDNGGVDVSVIRVEDYLQFEIRDTGIGIPKNKADNLFKAFEQLDSSIARKYGGTGLGLSISKFLVEQQGGKIWVKSEEGRGSSFFFHIKCEVGTEKDLERLSEIEEVDVEKLKGIRILIAEDHPLNQIVIFDTLKNLIPDVHVELVNNGLEVIEKAESMDFDLILMDVNMPELDGLSATRKLRNSTNQKLHKIPVIALTASVLNSEIQKCLDAGMNGSVPKPFKREELLKELLKWV